MALRELEMLIFKREAGAATPAFAAALWLSDLLPKPPRPAGPPALALSSPVPLADALGGVSAHNLRKVCYCRADPSEINISDEMSKITVWKALTMDSDAV